MEMLLVFLIICSNSKSYYISERKFPLQNANTFYKVSNKKIAAANTLYKREVSSQEECLWICKRDFLHCRAVNVVTISSNKFSCEVLSYFEGQVIYAEGDSYITQLHPVGKYFESKSWRYFEEVYFWKSLKISNNEYL